MFTLIATALEGDALPPGLDKAAVLETLKGGKALGAASLVLQFNHSPGAAVQWLPLRTCSYPP